jgi:4-amino-4-deoxy-L-arabinose transferase-like glycosyltransferase
MKRIYPIIILGFILALAIVLRFWQLGSVPISPDWDEAALGYNAYSILKTGKDEYGSFLPLSFRSFNDYKPPLYVYLTVPSVAVFGLSVWSVRLPSALFGVLAVLGTFLLVQTFIRNAKESSEGNVVIGLSADVVGALPFVAALLLAISPWHIQFSRVAFEANIALTLVIWASYYFFLGFYSKSGFPISAILFALSLYTYHSERIFVPCLVILLFIIYRSRLFIQKKREVALAILIGVIILLPLVPVFLNNSALSRFAGSSVFQKQTELLSGNVMKLAYDKANGDKIGTLLDNRRIEYTKIIIRNYLSHFNPNWLFVTGDLQRHHAPGMGLLYLWELPFILIGIYRLARGKGPVKSFIFGWFLLAPIAAAPTVPSPHAVRSLVLLPMLQVFTAIGLLATFSSIRTRYPFWKTPYIIGMSAVILGMFVYYTHMYFVHMNTEYSEYWQFGYKEVVTLTESIKSKYDRIVVSSGLEESYIFFLFYTKYDPVKYLAGGGTESQRVNGEKSRFDKYVFRPILWSSEVRNTSEVYVGTAAEIEKPTIALVKNLDGTGAIAISE